MNVEEYKSLNKVKKKYNLLEDSICQSQLVPWFKLMENCGKLKARWNKITNEAMHGSKLLRFKEYRMGKKPGMGDYLFEWGTGSGWLEVKKPGGKQTDNQKQFQEECKKWGIGYEVVHDINEAKTALKKWGIVED